MGAVANITAYHRPLTLPDALALLGQPATVVIGGGTKVNTSASASPVDVVDLQSLDLDRIEPIGLGHLSIGATATLQAITEDIRVPDAIRAAAHHDAPNTLRNAATVGGCVAAGDAASELLAALLVHGALVVLAGPTGDETTELEMVLGDPGALVGRIITAVVVETGGVTATARTGRTAADQPIVAAVGRRTPDGARRVALTGVAAHPVISEDVAELEPPADFRGSTEYRRALALTLSARVLEAID